MTLALAAVCALVAATAAEGAVATPSVRFVDLSPVTVKAAGFVPSEQVRVTLHAGTVTRIRTVTVSSTGSFSVSFGKIASRDRCDTLINVVAKGSHGDRAARTLPTLNCPDSAGG
jgi:hypothetical protein